MEMIYHFYDISVPAAFIIAYLALAYNVYATHLLLEVLSGLIT
jgi:hypothetical protein